MRRQRAVHGFTLLEVLVAVAILGLGLTVVLSAQTGVFWSYSRATRMSQAPGLARCKMEEIELELLTRGYPVVDENDEGDCCEDSQLTDYHCLWTIERVELPNLLLEDEFSGDAGVPSTAEGELGPDGEELMASSSGTGGPLSALAAISQTSGAALGDSPTIGGLSDMMGGDGAGAGVASMVMGLVYPDLKPMLEASIRKVTVTVRWKEGRFERDLSVTQYLTNPMQGGFDPLAGAVIDAVTDQVEQAEGLEDVLPGGQ